MKRLLTTVVAVHFGVTCVPAAIGVVSATPDMAVVATLTTITITAPIDTNPTPLPGGVNLQRLTNGVWQVIGQLYDDGSHGDVAANDGIFTAQLLTTEQTASQVQFRVSAAYRGALTRSLSNVVIVNIIEHAPFATPVDPSTLLTDVDTKYPPSQVVFILKPGYGWADAQAIAASRQGQIIGFAPSANSFQLFVAGATTVAAISALIVSLQNDTRILNALPNVFGNLSVSNDLTNLKSAQPNATAAYDTIQLFDAWNYLSLAPLPRSFSAVSVGILDSGIDARHPAFSGVNLGQTSISDEADYPPECHGTSVAGIIGAGDSQSASSSSFFRMNGIVSGIPGSFPGKSAIPYTLEVRKFGSDLESTLSQIDSLAMVGARVVNMSIDFTSVDAVPNFVTRTLLLCPPSTILGTCLVGFTKSDQFVTITNQFQTTLANHPGIIFVVSAGNVDTDVVFQTPANIVANNVIAVGGTTVSGGGRWKNTNNPEASSYGANVAVSAPAENVYTTTCYSSPLSNGDYHLFGGTSAAAPLVTGTIALMLSVNNGLTPAAVKKALLSTTTALLNSDQPIGGLLNTLRAVQAVGPALQNQPPTAGFTMSSGNQSATDGQTLSLTVTQGGSASVTFSDQSHANLVGGSIVSWIWSVSGSQVSTATSFSRSFTKGTYQVSLFVGDNTGTFGAAAIGTLVVTETVPTPPTAGFTMSSGNQSATDGQTLSLTVLPGSSTSLTLNGTTRSQAYNGATVTGWQWTIDGNSVSTSSSFSISLAKGTHPIALVVTDSLNNNSAPAAGTISVSESSGPTAGFVASWAGHSATDGQVLNLTVSTGGVALVSFVASRSSSPTGSIVGWQWTIDAVSVSNQSSFAYNLAKGNHPVALIVTDSFGARSVSAQGSLVISESAGQYTYIKLADSSIMGQFVTANINNRGNVVFNTQNTSPFFQGLFVTDGSTVTAIANTAPGSQFSLIVQNEATINNQNTILFVGRTSATGLLNLFGWSGGSPSLIFSSYNLSQPWPTVNSISFFNDSGVIGFLGEYPNASTQQFVLNGSAVVPLTLPFSLSPFSVNNLQHIGVSGFIGSNQLLELTDLAGNILRTVAQTGSQFTTIYYQFGALNDKDSVAFAASTQALPIGGIWLAQGPSTTLISAGGAGIVGLNNNDAVSFFDPTSHAIKIWSTGTVNTVISPTDSALGFPIQSLDIPAGTTFTHLINDAGQVVFLVTSTNGIQYLFRADPI